MKQFIILLLAFIALVSCDGRDRKYKSNQEVLKEHKLLDSFSTKTTYFPAEYTEKVTDTILSNKLRVKMKYYSLENDAILNEFKVDTITHKHYHRRFAANIEVFNNLSIFKKTITKATILDIDKTNEAFLNTAIMRLVWIDDLKSLENNKAIINILFCKPETDDCLMYKLTVNTDGTYSLNQTNDSYYNEL